MNFGFSKKVLATIGELGSAQQTTLAIDFKRLPSLRVLRDRLVCDLLDTGTQGCSNQARYITVGA